MFLAWYNVFSFNEKGEMMLQLLLGRAGSGKTHTIKRKILQKINENKKNILLIVPEQISFETEKDMLSFLGEKLNTQVLITSFKRLAEYIFEKTGNFPKERISTADKTLLMSLAIDSIKKDLKLYKDSSDKELIDIMLSASDEFKKCYVENVELEKISNKLQNKILKYKLDDTIKILDSYNKMLSGKYLDPMDELSLAYRELRSCNIFKDFYVFVDGFDGFTQQQMLILTQIALDSAYTCVSFCADEEEFIKEQPDLFSPIYKNIRKILDMAKENNVAMSEPIFLSENHRAANELNILEKNFFRSNKTVYESAVNNVVVYRAKNLYEEVDFVARAIKRLVFKENCKYRDISVISRSVESYEGVIENCFKKYNIPLFLDKREPIDSKPLTQFIVTLLSVMKTNFSSEYVFKYLKIGLWDFSYEEISDLENYVLLWGIDHDQWKANFSASPSGISKKITDEDIEKLKELNAIREKIILPILKFSDKVKSCDGEKFTKELYNFIETINLRKKLEDFAEKLAQARNDILSAEQPRLWDLTMDILDKMAFLLRGTKTPVGKYLQLLKLVVLSSDLGTIPAKLDEVTFSAADRPQPRESNIVFIIGANEGDFPRKPASAGVFSDSERCQLISLGVNMYDSLEGIAMTERFLAYKAVSNASKKLFVTFSTSTLTGGVKKPSEIIRNIESIFPKVKILDEFSFEQCDEIWSLEQALEVCSEHLNDGSRFSNTLKHYFLNSKYKNYIENLEKAIKGKSFELQCEESGKLLFGENLKFSASQVEKYYSCPFQFFCQYGLLAKSRKKATFDSLEYGNLMHFVLEKVLSSLSDKEILCTTDSELEKVIVEKLNLYIKLKLGSWDGKSKRFQYLFSRLTKAAVPIIRHIAEELSQSEFKATDFELSISENSNVQPMKMQLPDGTFVEVEGKIDRVDIMKKGSENYVRVIDYKTGAKEFKLSDILYGLNLQMLIYLMILSKSPSGKYKNIVPCGILYMPSIKPVVSALKNTGKEKIESQKLKKLRMNGLLLESAEVICGMEKDAKGIFIPAYLKNGQVQKNESVVSAANMGKILKHIENLFINMANELKSGKIRPNPVKGLYDACEFCNYSEICNFTADESGKHVEKKSNEEVMELLLDKP